jgi:hypothetical protein
MALAPSLPAAVPAPVTTGSVPIPIPIAQQQQRRQQQEQQQEEEDEFSMEAMSQSTTLFHDQTHRDGAPIELDSSLPNNFNKERKDKDKDKEAAPVVNVSRGGGGGGGGKNKGLALLNSLKSTSASSDDLLTDYAITTSAQQEKIRGAQDSKIVSPVPKTSPSTDTTTRSASPFLFSPSDVTGVRRQFLKQ